MSDSVPFHGATRLAVEGPFPWPRAGWNMWVEFCPTLPSVSWLRPRAASATPPRRAPYPF